MGKKPNVQIYSAMIALLATSNCVYANDSGEFTIDYKLLIDEYMEEQSNIDKFFDNKDYKKFINSISSKNYSKLGTNEARSDYYSLIKMTSRLILEKSTPDIESQKAELSSLIEQAKALYASAEFFNEEDDTTDREGKYPLAAGQALLQGIQDCENVLATATTVAEVADAIVSINDNINGFIESKVDREKYKEQLVQMINDARRIYNNAVVGIEIGEFPAESKSRFADAIDSAQSIYDNPSATSSDITIAISDIYNEIGIFERSEIKRIDYSKLESAVQDTEAFVNSTEEGDRPGQYPKSERDKMMESLDFAKSLIGECKAKDIDMRVAELQAAKAKFELTIVKFEDIDRTELKSILDNSEDFMKNIVIGQNKGEYSQESVDTFKAEFDYCKGFFDEARSNQIEIDAASNQLSRALETLKLSVNTADTINKEDLINTILEAEELINTTQVGDNIGEVNANTQKLLQTALENAKAIATSETASQSDINTANVNLSNALKEFKDNINVLADKRALRTALDSAEKFASSITVDMIGDNAGQYPRTAKDKLDSTITSGNNTYASKSSTQSDVDKAKNDVDNAVIEFKNSIIVEKTDLTQLKSSIDKAKNVLSLAVVGTEDGEYPQEAYDKLNESIEVAVGVYNSPSSSQELIDSTTIKLVSDTKTFESSVISNYLEYKNTLKTDIQECQKIIAEATVGEEVDCFTHLAFNEFKSAIAAAEKVYLSDSKQSSTYISASKKLSESKTEFLGSKITQDDVKIFLERAQKALQELNDIIKSTTVGTQSGGVPENRKVALMTMHTKISDLLEKASTVSEAKEAEMLTRYTISDFNDASLHIDKNKKVQGRLLTGVVETASDSYPQINIQNSEVFIPEAGLPVDVKSLFATSGTLLASLGVWLNIKSNKKK